MWVYVPRGITVRLAYKLRDWAWTADRQGVRDGYPDDYLVRALRFIAAQLLNMLPCRGPVFSMRNVAAGTGRVRRRSAQPDRLPPGIIGLARAGRYCSCGVPILRRCPICHRQAGVNRQEDGVCEMCDGKLADGYRLGFGDASTGRTGYRIREGKLRSQDARPDAAGFVACVHCGHAGIKDTAAYCEVCGHALHAPGTPMWANATNEGEMPTKVQKEGTGRGTTTYSVKSSRRPDLRRFSMSDTSARARASYLASLSRPTPAEAATRQYQPWPGPITDEFLAHLGKLDRAWAATKEDADNARWQQDQAQERIHEAGYDVRLELTVEERHEYGQLCGRVARCGPLIREHERIDAERNEMLRVYDRVRLRGTADEPVSLAELEAEFGRADEWSLAVSELASKRIARKRRDWGRL